MSNKKTNDQKITNDDMLNSDSGSVNISSDNSFRAENIHGSVIVAGNVSGSVQNVQKSEQSETSIELVQLARELSELRKVMSQEANSPDEYIAVGEVAKAEKAAHEESLPQVLEYLKLAGNWTLEVATKIGVSVATEAIKQATGLR